MQARCRHDLGVHCNVTTIGKTHECRDLRVLTVYIHLYILFTLGLLTTLDMHLNRLILSQMKIISVLSY